MWCSAVSVPQAYSLLSRLGMRCVGTGSCGIALGRWTYRYADLPAVYRDIFWTFLSAREGAPEARPLLWSIFDSCTDTDCVRRCVSRYAHMVDWRSDGLSCHTGLGLHVMDLC